MLMEAQNSALPVGPTLRCRLREVVLGSCALLITACGPVAGEAKPAPEDAFSISLASAPALSWSLRATDLADGGEFTDPGTQFTNVSARGLHNFGEVLVTTLEDTESNSILALDTLSGNTRWSVRVEAKHSCASEAVEGLLACLVSPASYNPEPTELQFYRLSDGTVAYSHPMRGARGVEVSAGVVYLVGGDGKSIWFSSGTPQNPFGNWREQHVWPNEHLPSPDQWPERTITSGGLPSWSNDPDDWPDDVACIPGFLDIEFTVVDKVLVHKFRGVTVAVRGEDGGMITTVPVSSVTVLPGLGVVGQECRGGPFVILDRTGAPLRRIERDEEGRTFAVRLDSPGEEESLYFFGGTAYDFDSGAIRWDAPTFKAMKILGETVLGTNFEESRLSMQARSLTNGDIVWTSEEWTEHSGERQSLQWAAEISDGQRLLVRTHYGLAIVQASTGTSEWNLTNSGEGHPEVIPAGSGFALVTLDSISVYAPS